MSEVSSFAEVLLLPSRIPVHAVMSVIMITQPIVLSLYIGTMGIVGLKC